MEELGKAMERVRDRLESVASDARTDDASKPDTAHEGGVNVAGRVNAAVAGNVGSRGSVHAVSSTQHVRIRQEGGETAEESVTTRREL